MEVRAGYKLTEVGVIPEDWDVKRLGELCVTYSGGTPPTLNREYYGGDIPWITSSDLNQGSIESVDGRITLKGLENSAAKMVDEGVLLVALYGATAGVTAITHIKGAINQAILAVIPKSDDTSFFYHHLSFRKEWVIKTFTQGGQPNLSGEIVNFLPIPVPKRIEQRAIATALSDVDVLLAAQDKLIAKKRDIKQAVMQQLLTGKQRLPGFSGEWEVKRLGDVAELKNGFAFKSNTYTEFGQFKVVTIANVQDGYMTVEECNKVADIPADLQRHQKLICRDILISMTGNVGRACRVVEDDCLLNQRVGKLVPFAIDDDFFFSQLCRPIFANEMALRATGGAQGNLGKSDIVDYELAVPVCLEEQAAIATVLSDMDAEIAALEQQRDKTRALKQGMMQELLTGKIRMVNREGKND